jgi:hypothetical protein
MEGVSHDEARKFVIEKAMEASFYYMTRDADKAKMYADMAALLDEYFKFYGDELDKFEILEVELKVEDPSFGFVGRIDLLVRWLVGEHKGKISVWDHKFLYNFWSAKAYRMNASSANYIRAIRSMYPDEKHGPMIFSEIRFRPDARDRFHREEVPYQPVKHRNINKNHVLIAKRVNELSAMSREEVDEEATRAFIKTTCDFCLVESLCNLQLQNLDTKTMEMVNFKRNDYGYTDDTE